MKVPLRSDRFPGNWIRSGLTAAALVTLASLLLLQRPSWISVPVWLPLLIAVVISAWLVGGVAGWIAVALSIFSFDVFFTPPLFSLAIAPEEMPFFLLFSVSAFAAHAFGTWRRRSESGARAARDELERRVAERTQECQATNDLLRGEIAMRQRAELEQQEARAELAHFSRVTTLGELAASIAHEINQPLAAIVTNGDACRRWLASNPPNLLEAKLSLEAIDSDARRASAVIARIRAFVKKRSVEHESLSVNHLIREIFDLMSAEFERHDIEVSLDLAPGLPPVMGDRVQLQQVILNLLINATEAIRATEHAVREIGIRSRLHADRVVVEVRDSGPGISSAAMDQLFTPFFTTKTGGMGLGLSISRTIVEAHGGKLEAARNPEHGMRFDFSIPVHPASVPRPAMELAPERGSRAVAEAHHA